MSAVTALTAQNTTGVYGIMEVTPEFLASQLDCVFTDIRPDAVKTGMVSSSGLIRVIGEKLKEYHAEHLVTDPVMVSTSGSRLLQEGSHGDFAECASAYGPGDHAQYSRGGSTGRDGDPLPGGYGGGRRKRSGRPTAAPSCARAATI